MNTVTTITPQPADRKRGAGANSQTPALQGQVTHAAFARLVTAGVRAPSYAQLRDAVISLPVVRQAAPTHRVMFTARAVSALGVYFRRYSPPADWQPDGVEVGLDGTILDAIWRSRCGLIVFDELKTGTWRASGRDGHNAQQLKAQLDAGRTTYGGAFLGVRQLWLHGKAQSLLHLCDGGSCAATAAALTKAADGRRS